MNDFTKEELKCIASWGDVYCFDNAMSARINSDLINKIQSMIDNYQEQCNKPWPSNMLGKCPECGRYHDE